MSQKELLTEYDNLTLDERSARNTWFIEKTKQQWVKDKADAAWTFTDAVVADKVATDAAKAAKKAKEAAKVVFDTAMFRIRAANDAKAAYDAAVRETPADKLMQQTEELKPCPLCGGEAKRYGEYYVEWVKCNSCGFRSGTAPPFLSPKELTEYLTRAWNTLTPDIKTLSDEVRGKEKEAAPKHFKAGDKVIRTVIVKTEYKVSKATKEYVWLETVYGGVPISEIEHLS